jgi:hypothetical protein
VLVAGEVLVGQDLGLFDEDAAAVFRVLHV